MKTPTYCTSSSWGPNKRRRTSGALGVELDKTLGVSGSGGDVDVDLVVGIQPGELEAHVARLCHVGIGDGVPQEVNVD